MTIALEKNRSFVSIKPLRLGFVGVGWIGRNRMNAIINSGLADITALADQSSDCINEAKNIAPDAKTYFSLDDLISDNDLDGIVIATPSALHSKQTIYALQNGLPVFCQKPLARNYYETFEVVNFARSMNLLLGVDFSYRYTDAFQRSLSIINSGEIGDVYAIDLIFHNAFGPGKEWFYDISQSGGGCVIDLGIHLIDLAFHSLNFPDVKKVSSKIFSNGKPITNYNVIEDYASALIELENEAILNLNCSWNLSAGKDVIIEINFHGTKGGILIKNVNGSYYDFTGELYHGTSAAVFCQPPDNWGGRAAVNWLNKLKTSNAFDETAEEFLKVAYTVDKIYGRI